MLQNIFETHWSYFVDTFGRTRRGRPVSAVLIMKVIPSEIVYGKRSASADDYPRHSVQA